MSTAAPDQAYVHIHTCTMYVYSYLNSIPVHTYTYVRSHVYYTSIAYVHTRTCTHILYVPQQSLKHCRDDLPDGHSSCAADTSVFGRVHVEAQDQDQDLADWAAVCIARHGWHCDVLFCPHFPHSRSAVLWHSWQEALV